MSHLPTRRPGVALTGLIALGILLGDSGAAQAQPTDIAGSPSGAPGTGSTSGSGGSFAAPDPVSTLPAPATTAIRLAGAPNFRDIGGYRTADGHTVRTGKVFRSNKLGGLTDADLATLAAANVNLDVDLRNTSERAAAPDRVPAGARYQVADVESADGGVSFHDFPAVTLGVAVVDGLLNGSTDLGQSVFYPFMIDYHGGDVAFGSLLTAIAQNTGGATIYHCTYGKDRTGWATAVLLTILGVPRDVVNADYLASNAELGNPTAVQLSWLEAAFNEVDRLYGSFDAYVHDGLGLSQATVDTLRAELLN
ncbi:tyrosine-protein phosphatase [Nocardia stercoris]|uniref:Tyrosine-protein phosphatase n=1 Tax=Nocardia stercoris TaxID=2483361 RepID=A0A3M2L1W5_9NOCA|nr:tyrosine-protein phosphatase [Nocardia stercoris]RMI30493.1 tyrosine-protein phosphatase [Nocardia stercoris]